MFDDLIPQKSPYADAIGGIESGRRYDAIGPQTGKGRALGYYQVMDFNVGPWSKEILGREVTPGEFIRSPEIQDAIFNGKFGSYVSKYGPEGAAKAWFAGEEGMKNPNARDVLGTTVAQYANKFNRAMPSEASSQSKSAAPKPALSFDDLIPQVPLPQPAPESRNPEGPPAPPVNMVQKALEPITDYPATQSQMANESYDQMARGAGQVKEAIVGDYAPAKLLSGVGNVALGGIGYVASPINAALRTVAGKPIEENFDVPKELTETALGFVLPVPGTNMTAIRSVPNAARELTAGERVVQAGENLANVGQGGAVKIPQAVASDNMSTQRAAAAIGNIPFSGNPIVRAADDTVKSLGAKATDVAAEYGAGSKMTAGESASGGIVDWITKTSKEKASRLYDKVDELVDADKLVTPKNTKQVIYNLTSEEVKNLPRDRALQTIIDVFQGNARGLTYADTKQVRSHIGNLIDQGIVPEGISQGTLKRLYAGLTKDVERAVQESGGMKAHAAFLRANRYYDLISDRRASLAKIVGREGDVPAEQVFDRLIAMAGNSSRADMSKLAQARKAMGADNWNEVASAFIQQMGRFEDATGNVVFSPQRFLTAYQDKLSPTGRTMLFRSAGKESIAPYLDDIATVSTRFRQLQKFANPSGTGQTVAGTTGLAALYAEPITAISSAVGTRLIAQVLANPATVAPAAQWTQKYEIAFRAPTPANVARLTIASRNLANTVNAEFGASVQYQDLLKAIQGPVKGRAEDEQPEPVRVIDQ
jgi:hypothetical protein